MAAIARHLSDEQISAVAGWLAAQPVPTPASARDAPPGPPPLDCGRATR
jgi:cytochrome c553